MNKRLPLGLGIVLPGLQCSLLVAFTHCPVVRALINSLWNTASSQRPSRFAGTGNHEALLAYDKLMQVLTNSGLYALGAFPLAIFQPVAWRCR